MYVTMGEEGGCQPRTWTYPKVGPGNWCPNIFNSPYKVTQSHPEILIHTLNLPQELKAWRIFPSFHVSLLFLYHKSDNTVFPKCEVHVFYEFSNAKDNEWLVDHIITHKWDENNILFLVQWNLGDTTWEPYTECKELMALDQYLHWAFRYRL